jgi:hypothetical protein
MIAISSTCSETWIDTDKKQLNRYLGTLDLQQIQNPRAIVAILVAMYVYNPKWGTMAIRGKNTIFDNLIS